MPTPSHPPVGKAGMKKNAPILFLEQLKSRYVATKCKGCSIPNNTCYCWRLSLYALGYMPGLNLRFD